MPKVENGEVTINIEYLYESLDEAQRKEFLQNLAWTDDIFNDVAKEVLDGYATSSYNSNIYNLRKTLLEQVGILEKSYLRDLLYELKRAYKEEELVRSNRYSLVRLVQQINSKLPEEEEKIKFPIQYETRDKYTISEMVDMILQKDHKM